MFTEIVGVNHYSALVFLNDQLKLMREPNNHYDPNAIAVFKNSDKVGYLSRVLAKNMAPKLDNGDQYKVHVMSLGNGYVIPVQIIKE